VVTTRKSRNQRRQDNLYHEVREGHEVFSKFYQKAIRNLRVLRITMLLDFLHSRKFINWHVAPASFLPRKNAGEDEEGVSVVSG
jgi:hypothetical protein